MYLPLNYIEKKNGIFYFSNPQRVSIKLNINLSYKTNEFIKFILKPYRLLTKRLFIYFY